MSQDQQPPFASPQPPPSAGSGALPGAASAGLLRRTIASEEISQTPTQIQTLPGPPAVQPASPPPPVETNRGRFWPLKPRQAPKTPRPKQPARIKTRLLIVAALLVVVWFVGSHQGAGNQAPAAQGTSTAGASGTPTTAPAGTATVTTPTGATPTPAPTTIVNNLPPEKVAGNFLAAYFTWDGPQEEKDYTQNWAWMVAPGSLAALEQAAPRHTLDNGNDVAAQSPTPNVPGSAIHLHQQTAIIDFNWTVEVIPPGGELSTWVPREMHSEVTLARSSAGWQVTNVTWGEGGP